MQAYIMDSHCPIAELFYQVCQAGHLTRSDRQQIMSAFLSDALTDEEKAAINRLVHAVRRGWLKVLD